MIQPEELHRTRGWTDAEEFHHRMRADPRFAAELAICAGAGIPHSIFLGRLWPDPAHPRAPQWRQDDRDKAVAYRLWAGQLCPGCGLHPLDWERERDELYEAKLTTCHGCREQADRLAQIPETVSQARRAAMHVHLEKRDPTELLLLLARERGDIPDD